MAELTRRDLIAAGGAIAICERASASVPTQPAQATQAPLKGSKIRHTVVFRLKPPLGSAAEADFFEATKTLEALPSVQRFERLRQVSHKNTFTFGLSMEFADDEAYASYNNHPVHQAFLREHWVPEVEEFLEIDYVPLV